MECRTARELLDSARPDSADREDAELQAAFAHVDECEACAEVVEFRRAFDRRVGQIVRDVAVPKDLRVRLEQAIVPPVAGPAPQTVVNAPQRQMRRAWMLAASAALLLVAASWSFYRASSAPAPLAAKDVLHWWQTELARPGFNVADLPEFDGSFEVTVVDGRWRSLSSDEPRGADIDRDGTADAAVFPFSGGFIVVLAPNRVSDPPTAGSAKSATEVYAPVPHVAWTYNGSMHICFLPGGTQGQLRLLLDQVYGNAA